MIMGKLSEIEEEWQRRATAAAIAGARKIALRSGPLMNTPVGRLNDNEWGWIVTAAIFAWIETRVQQAIAEGRDQETMVRLTGLTPDPCDVAVITSILGELADKAALDWSQPLSAWPKAVMTNFLMLAWSLINEAESVRDHGTGTVLKNAEYYDWKTGDPVPF
jgi:hypothetical protein